MGWCKNLADGSVALNLLCMEVAMYLFSAPNLQVWKRCFFLRIISINNTFPLCCLVVPSTQPKIASSSQGNLKWMGASPRTKSWHVCLYTQDSCPSNSKIMISVISSRHNSCQVSERLFDKNLAEGYCVLKVFRTCTAMYLFSFSYLQA